LCPLKIGQQCEENEEQEKAHFWLNLLSDWRLNFISQKIGF
jgi:hypothetical protein